MAEVLHELKTWPGPFQATLEGRKHHEVRRADRAFAVGDHLRLREWQAEPSGGEGGYTGRELTVKVTYLSAGGSWGLPADLCVMSVERLVASTQEPLRAAASAALAVLRMAERPQKPRTVAKLRAIAALERALQPSLEGDGSPAVGG